ncbi:LysR substrate-binding domain-containing protein [Dongshaea marina]|uniref:LysR substrate-binding domain-containing protein n=1 Tax=Dongshaea marina TaxID=2047966 RepID=UPI000D3EBC31|nr:LysR substrate-binding domain-containing protein [Dongshaea marina]
MQSWEGIREFIAVAQEQSFTKAAKRLRLSTAQVSRQISALERRLAVKLFHRTTRKVSLTEGGALFHQQCKPLQDGLEEARRALTQLHETPAGNLRITAPVSYGEKTIAPLLHDFMERYPELSIELQLTNQTLDLLEGGFDLAIRLGQLKDSGMIARKLASRSIVTCASVGYLSRKGTPHTVSELSHHNCLLGTLEFWRFHLKGNVRPVRVQGSLSCNSGFALVDAALKGIGIVQLPDYYLQSALEEAKLIPVLEAYKIPDEGIWALYPQNRQLSTKLRLLLEFLSQGLSSHE